MRHFLKGFIPGIVIGGLLVWLYQRYLCAAPQMLPTRPVGQIPDDDLAALRGIGPAFAERLLRAGIRTYADLSRLTPDQVAARCQVPAWRVRRDDWVGQAAVRLNF